MPAKRPDIKTKYDAFSTGSKLRKQNQDVRVGYIDPEKGYVDGLTVFQANKYAEANPGTQFIHKNRDRVAYININTVNKLTNQNVKPKQNYNLTDGDGNYTGCNTVKGLITSPDGTELPNQPGEGTSPFVPEPSSGTGGTGTGSGIAYGVRGTEVDPGEKQDPIVIIEGGGGVGAVGKAIIGEDGSLLHVRVVHGGFGYRFPPRVRIFDPNQRGAGATAKSFTGRMTVTSDQPIRFDQESDVEDYDFNLPPLGFDPSSVPFGQSYSLSSNTVVGDWDPRKILSVTEATGFEQQLRKYLDFLAGFDPNKPWWTTRNEEPVKVVGEGQERSAKRAGNILFPVEHPAWGGEKNISKDLVNVEFEVYGQGTRGNRSIVYEFTAQDGSHKFRVKGVTHEARNEKTRVDVIKVKANTTYDVKASVIKGRGAKSEIIEQGLLEKAGKRAKENREFQTTQRSSTIFGDIVGSLNDNDDIQITAKRGRFKGSNRKTVEVEASDAQKEKFKGQPNRFKRASFDLTYRVNVPGATKVTRTISPSFMNNNAVCPTLPSHKEGSDMHGELYTMIWKEQFPHDGQYTFRGICDDKANVYIDGEKIMVLPGHKGTDQNFAPKKHKMFIEEGLHEIKVDLLNKTFKKIIKRTITGKGGKSRIPVDFEVYGQGSQKNTNLRVIFTATNGTDTFTIRPKKDFVRGKYRYTKTVKLFPNIDYKVHSINVESDSSASEGGTREIPIELAAPGTKGRGKRARIGKVERKKIQYLDERGDDPNAQLSIDSTSPALTAKFSDDGSKLITKGNGFVTLKFKWDDNPRSAGKAVGELTVKNKTFKQNGEKGVQRETIKIGNSAGGNPQSETTIVHPINFTGLNPKNNPIEVSGNNRTNKRDALKLKDGSGNDTNAKIIIEDVKGGTANFTRDGRGIEVKGNCDIRITLEWNDNPNTAGVALDKFEIGGKVWAQRGRKGVKTQTINLRGSIPAPPEKPFKLVPEQGTIRNNRFTDGGRGIEGGSRPSRVMFADTVGSANDNDDMQIMCSAGIFTPSNKRNIKGSTRRRTETRGTWDLVYRLDNDSPNDSRLNSITKQLKKGGFSTDVDLQEVTVFNTNEYINRANRKLFKVYPCADQKKSFFTQNAVTPFNPLELDKDFPKITRPRPQKPQKPRVHFEQDGKNLKLKVIGSGKVKIGFQLKTDDNFRTSGVFAEEVRISADGPDVKLKRTKTKRFNASGKSRFQGRDKYSFSIKEKEKINGEGVFTAGREYNIKVIGGSSTSGFKTVDKTKVYFDDDIDGGFDKNGALRIKYINVIEEKKDLGPLPNGAANKIPSTRYTGDTNDYAGTHTIRWNNVRFPVTGNYKIGVMVDDNVRIEIGTKQKGNVVNIYKKGFTAPGRSSGVSEYIENIPEGNYTITAYLQQIPGRPINDGNPMGLAINIDTVFAEVEEEVIINKSWWQNPYGAALTIHAPLPPVPTENITQEDSQCPKNPIWTTRFNQASGEDRWIPVNHRDASGRRTWSRFMNSYALSPILPLGTPSSGRGGETWETKWDLDIPYDGFYNFKGTVDNKAQVSIGTHVIKKLDGFGTPKKDLTDNKIFLRKGKVEISASVFNEETRQPVLIERKCFNSADWATKPKDKPDKIGVDFDVYGQGSIKNMGLKFVFQEKGGSDTFTIDNVSESKAVEKVSKRVKRNTDYKVTAIATGTHAVKSKTREYPLKFEDLNPANRTIEVSGKNSTNKNDTLKLRDGRGSDANVKFTIRSTSPGVSAKFSDDGRKLITKGDGDVTIRLKYDDNPRYAGEAVRSITIAGTKWTKRRQEYGEETKTIQVGRSSGSTRKNITKSFPIKFNNLNPANNPIEVSGNNRRKQNDALKLKDGGGSDTNAKIIIEDVKGGTAQFSDDGRSLICNGSVEVRITLEWDDNPGDNGVALDSFEIGGKVWRRRGRDGDKTQTIRLDATQAVPSKPEEVKLVPEQGTSKIFGRGKKGTESQIPGQIIFADIIGSANDNDDMQIRCNKGIFTPSNKRKGVKGTSGQGTQRRNTWDLTFRVDAAEEAATTITELNGVNYKGPELASYRTGKLGRLISPFFPLGEDQGGELLNGRTWEMVWENVDFPISGNYDFRFEVDDVITVSVSNEESKSKNITYKQISKTTLKQVRENGNNPILKKARIEKGKRNVKVVLENASLNRTFRQNPTYFGMKIKFKDFVLDADRRSWLTNPVGISAVLLAPPCPKDPGGVGILTAITVDEPGNGYEPKPPGDSDYVNVAIELTELTIRNPGIGYTPGDQAIINGRSFPIKVGEFGKVVGVGLTPIPITSYPEISISTRTGTNFDPVPVTRLVVDPLDEENVIQITDLAGLKQTGYIQGRAYYGEVYYENGIPFAGRYKTAGTPIQVYATLQESIDGEVTTRPSAIQRSGTDVTNNDPRLNIPGTPDNLV